MAHAQGKPASVGPISSFAHLAGVLAAKADNDKDEKDDEEDRKKDEKEDKEAKTKKASAEEEEACDEGDDEPQKKGKKAKAEKEKDTSNDDKDYDDGKVQRARHAERDRIHAIMTCIGAAHAVEEAERLAFSTDMSADLAIGHLNVKAIELLSAKALKPAAKKDPLRDRMASVELPDIGPDAPSNSTGDGYQDHVRTTAAAIIEAGKRRRGEKV
jgi:hypothetical protein